MTTTTYRWSNEDHTGIIATYTSTGQSIYISTADEDNGYYREFIASGIEPDEYVPPEPPTPETTEQKVDRLLSDYDLTREEMQAALAVKTKK
tara:strand:- start:27 stop:302 length:276 start_codon:yes stop_codon:yes gene_type:complete